jgi:hypothetical protein
MVLPRVQNARRSQSKKLVIFPLKGWKSSNIWENLKKIKHIHKEIGSRLKSGNACYRSVQNLLSSSLLSKNFED